MKLQSSLLSASLLVSLTLSCSHGAPAKSQYVVTGAGAPHFALGPTGSSVQLLLNPATGSRELSMNVLYLKPGATVPLHQHPHSDEAVYIQSGSVKMTIGEEILVARAGDAVYIPAGAQHSAKVLEGEDLNAVQVYVGPGPEQRFTKGRRLQ